MCACMRAGVCVEGGGDRGGAWRWALLCGTGAACQREKLTITNVRHSVSIVRD